MARRSKRETKGVILAESLDLRAAVSLHNELIDCRGKDLKVDASGVRRIGAQCSQILFAARSQWESEGLRFDIDSPSEDFIDGVNLLGLPMLAGTSLEGRS